MKKFAIISTALILVAAGIFSYSLYNYIQVDKSHNATVDEVETQIQVATHAATKSEAVVENAGLPEGYDDKGIFSANYNKAYTYITDLSNEELVGMLIIGTCSEDTDEAVSDVSKYHLSGYQFMPDCYANKEEVEIKQMAKKFKDANNGFIVAVDEEGGQVTTVTDHDAFSEYSFDSPRSLYENGGLKEVQDMEKDKLKVLKSASVNLNFAPILDLATESDQYMYSQALGADSTETGQYAQYVTKTFQDGNVSVCARHFPGYGTCVSTDEGKVVDTRSLEDLKKNDFLPFKSAVAAKCHMIMLSDAKVQSIDNTTEASLSSKVISILKDEVGHTGLIITSNLDNGNFEEEDRYVKAINCGNDLVLCDNYSSAYDQILEAVNDETISKDILMKAAMRVVAYKYTAGIIK